jgi:hypothetical protein
VSGWGQQYGFDEWVMVAASWAAAVRSMASVSAGKTNAATMEIHIQSLTAVVDAWRAAEMKAFLACYDAALANALIAAGRCDEARERVDLALQMAADTDWHIYDAELLRLRAHTALEPETRRADLRAAKQRAREQGAAVFELRAAADDFEVFGGKAARAELSEVLDRFPAEQTWPTLSRARALME